MMSLFKEKLKKSNGKLIIIICLVIGGIIFLATAINHINQTSVEQDANSMQKNDEKPVESNVRYTTQETLNTLTGQTDNMSKNVSTLQDKFNQMQSKTDARVSHMEKMLAQSIQSMNMARASLESKYQHTIRQIQTEKVKTKPQNTGYVINDGNNTIVTHPVKPGMTWIGESSPAPSPQHTATYYKNTIPTTSNGSLLHVNQKSLGYTDGSLSAQNNDNKPKSIPRYTIPSNTWLTGVTAEQPLIGVIKNSNQQVINPESVSFVIGRKNLAANNWHLPVTLKGIQGNALCEGKFVTFSNSYVQCSIKSLTFIFPDGTIDTHTVDGTASFGELTTGYGSPYIPGQLHDNATFAGAGTGIFSGIQGFGNAIASNQTQQTQGAAGFTYTIKNAFPYAGGSIAGAVGQAWNQWWLDLMKTTTNFVYAPNANTKTHQLLQFNAKITSSINIDYNPNGRKVIYETANNQQKNTSLD